MHWLKLKETTPKRPKFWAFIPTTYIESSARWISRPPLRSDREGRRLRSPWLESHAIGGIPHWISPWKRYSKPTSSAKIDIVGFDFRIESCGIHPEQPRRTRLMAAGLIEGAPDQIDFKSTHLVIKIDSAADIDG